MSRHVSRLPIPHLFMSLAVAFFVVVALVGLAAGEVDRTCTGALEAERPCVVGAP